MRWRKLVLIIVGLTVGAIVGYKVWEFVMVDDCLDAGGLWDYKTRSCDTTPE